MNMQTVRQQQIQPQDKILRDIGMQIRFWVQDVFALDQTNYPEAVYAQINEVATKAWKALPNKGTVSDNLMKILQGPTEPFSDFVPCLVEAVTRIFGDPDTAMPLVKQLVYEQCTKECRAAITPYKHKGLEVWMKVCREQKGLVNQCRPGGSCSTVGQI